MKTWRLYERDAIHREKVREHFRRNRLQLVSDNLCRATPKPRLRGIETIYGGPDDAA